MLNRVQLEGESFWDRFIITMDETWVPYFLPETKQQSKMWCVKGEAPASESKGRVSSSQKVMISVFWDSKGIHLIDYLQKWVTINADYYCNIIKNNLRRSIQNKRRGKIFRGILYHHDNARPHTAAKTKELLRSLGWEIVPHPSYSPD